MAVPFEAFLPYAVIVTLFAIGGGAMTVTSLARNDWKPKRGVLDKWDRQMFERDFRLTGKFRGQSDEPIAPESFRTSSWWKLAYHKDF